MFLVQMFNNKYTTGRRNQTKARKLRTKCALRNDPTTNDLLLYCSISLDYDCDKVVTFSRCFVLRVKLRFTNGSGKTREH